MPEYWKKCKHCGAAIVWLKSKDKNVPVNLDSIPLPDRQSLRMDLSVNYEPMSHRKHYDTCPHYRKNRKDFSFLRY